MSGIHSYTHVLVAPVVVQTARVADCKEVDDEEYMFFSVLAPSMANQVA